MSNLLDIVWVLILCGIYLILSVLDFDDGSLELWKVSRAQDYIKKIMKNMKRLTITNLVILERGKGKSMQFWHSVNNFIQILHKNNPLGGTIGRASEQFSIIGLKDRQQICNSR